MGAPGEPSPSAGESRALAAVAAYAIPYAVARHGPVSSLEEAAVARGVRPEDIIKTLVVRRADDDYLFVLVPGGRQFSWPKLRALLGISRLSMPDAAGAREVTGYERGTITPFGSTHPWPVIADTTVLGRTISLGAGAPGVSLTVSGDDVVRVLDAQVADIADDQAHDEARDG